MRITGKKSCVIYFFLLLFSTAHSQTLNYTFTSIPGTYTAISTPTAIPEIYYGSDDDVSGVYNIGFSFQFGCLAYTQFVVSSNGWLSFNTSAASSDPTNDLPNNTTMRPGVAPLWDDLAWNNNAFPPQCGYSVSGVSPTRVLTVQWTRAYWKISGGSPGAMSFQTKLYESTNRIEMIYAQETGSLNLPSASIGLAGIAVGDYYSVNTTFSAATKTTNVTTIASKPAQGLILRWDPPCSTLPIHLISFSGKNFGDKNSLKWITENEKNNDHFSLERSDDGINFYTIKEIKAQEDPGSQKNYEIIDDDIHNEVIYYKLKQTDHDKKYTYSPIISVGQEIENDSFYFSPNPANTKILIDKSGQFYSLINSSGQIKKQGIIENSEIDIETINDGLYFLKLGNLYKKLIILH